MNIKEIPKNEWTNFFDVLSRQHEGWRITAEIFGKYIGAQIQNYELTFEGISNEWDEVSGNTIFVMTGDKPDSHITHKIELPTHVSLERSDDGAHTAVAIKSADGTIALLRLRSPMLPEWVERVVPSVTQVPL